MERVNSEKILAEEVGILDNNSEWLGVPKSHLMECAGYSFTMEIIDRFKLKESSKVAIFCGTGNNGGDGFVIARHLSSFGIKSLLILVGPSSKIRTKEANLNWSILKDSLTISIETQEIHDSTQLSMIGKRLKEEGHDIVIDGLLGTGIKGKLREPASTAIEIINALKNQQGDKLKVVSIDVPSGLDPNTGIVHDKAVHADLVVTFHRNKKGLKVNSEHVKDVVVKSIGIPLEADLFVGRGNFLPTIKNRKTNAHKGQFGRILVIGGSKNYSGAPAFSSLTCIHFGCDLVITYTPQVIADVIRSYSPNMIVRASPGDWLNDNAFEELRWLIDWANTIIIGPGLGEEKETEVLFVNILECVKSKDGKKLVLDADALKLVKDHLDLIKDQEIILTPHEGEFKIMTGLDLPSHDDWQARAKMVKETAKHLGVVLLVKGPWDYVSDGKTLKINRTGCPEMAVGGTGDVLAGLCGCFLTTDNGPFESACSAAFLNGVIGEKLKKHQGPRFNAMDLILNIDEVITKIKNDSKT